MVCADCEKKLGKLAVPDKWRPSGGGGAAAAAAGRTGPAAAAAAASAPGTSKALALSKNSLLFKKQHTRDMLAQGKCKLCNGAVHQRGAYCQQCAYKKGICAMCGKKVLDVKNYRQSSV